LEEVIAEMFSLANERIEDGATKPQLASRG
jgi:hypothetical protein